LTRLRGRSPFGTKARVSIIFGKYFKADGWPGQARPWCGDGEIAAGGTPAAAVKKERG
jgi:hypothetical protein